MSMEHWNAAGVTALVRWGLLIAVIASGCSNETRVKPAPAASDRDRITRPAQPTAAPQDDVSAPEPSISNDVDPIATQPEPDPESPNDVDPIATQLEPEPSRDATSSNDVASNEPSVAPPVTESADDPTPAERLPALPSPMEGVCAFAASIPAPVVADNPNCPNGVWPGNLNLNSEEAVSQARGCVRVAGNVTVKTHYLTSLSDLSALRVIEGDLLIDEVFCSSNTTCSRGTSKLASLEGLNELLCIGGDVTHNRLRAPLDASALGNVVEIGGDLGWYVEAADQTFASLRRVWGSMNTLTPWTGSQLEGVYGVYRIAGNASTDAAFYLGCAGHDYCRDGVLGCDFTASTSEQIEQLANCQIARRNLYVSGPAVHELAKLSRLRHVVETLGIFAGAEDASDVTSLTGLDSIRSAGGLSVQGLSQLQDLQGISHVEIGSLDLTRLAAFADPTHAAIAHDRGYVFLSDLPALQSLHGLANLESLNALRISGCGGLQDLNGLDSLRELGVLHLERNANLRTLAGLSQLRSVHSVELLQNPLLEDVSALAGAPSLRLELVDLAKLADLSTLGGVEITNLTIQRLPVLRSLDGLEGARDSGISIVVYENPMLEDIEALGHVRDATEIRISHNPELPTLGGLGNVTSVKLASSIHDNASLPQCEVTALHARVRQITGSNNDYGATCAP